MPHALCIMPHATEPRIYSENHCRPLGIRVHPESRYIAECLKCIAFSLFEYCGFFHHQSVAHNISYII